MIYLDNAATTRVFDCAIEKAADIMRREYYNPNATYPGGVDAKSRLENARKSIAEQCGVHSDEIIFTSCATESNNWVFSCGIKNKKGNIVISAGEHSSVYNPAMALKNKGADVRIAPLKKDGAVDTEKLLSLVDSNTALVSVINVSNETGVINPVKEIAAEVKKRSKALVHSDGVQSFLKTDTAIDSLGVDYYSASAHKIGAPKGIGLLYVRHGLNIPPMIYGGGQEKNLRSGTQNTPYIAAFEAAVNKFIELKDTVRIKKLHNKLNDVFVSNGCKIIGGNCNGGYISCIMVPGVKAEILQNAVYDRGIVIGKGAACSGSSRGNRILSAIGLSQAELECCIRISTFVDTTQDGALSAAETILECAKTIRSNNV